MRDSDVPRVVNNSRSAMVFFDGELVVVASFCSSSVEFGSHMASTYYLLERPVDNEALVAAVRSAWANEDRESDFDKQQMHDSWAPIREIFGNERYDETNYVNVGRNIRSKPNWSVNDISVSATSWRNGNRDHGVQQGRSRLDPDCSDEELATAIRAAMEATSGPHDS